MVSPATRQRSGIQLQYAIFFASLTALLIALFDWPLRWLISGAPLWQFLVLLGGAQGNRILPTFHLWPLFSTLNLLYAISSTSWLLYWVFAGLCYPAIGLTCLFQFSFASNIARRTLRKLLRELHFIDDKIAFFEIPALEIDTHVDGLFVVRGVTFSLSTLSFVVHGVEVGVKLSDDMELAIQTDKVEVKLFRGIWVGDCYANVKGGKFEMTFGELEGKSEDLDGDQVLVEKTPLLNAATRNSDELSLSEVVEERTVKMTEKLTDGKTPEDSSPEEVFQDMKKLSPDNEMASGRYRQTLEYINETSLITEARELLKSITDKEIHEDDNALRAAICSQLHSKPSVPHPPRRSVRVSTIKQSTPPHIKRFQHRLPMLLRLLLNPLSYFHPVHFSAITGTASGRWIDSILVDKIFQEYGENDAEIRKLKTQISSWLSNANFAVELGAILGIAHVPLIASYDINCNLKVDDVMAYRTLPQKLHLNQVVRLGGADATVVVPTFLLPHHEHLLPPMPSSQQTAKLQQNVDDADGLPKTVQAEHELKHRAKDETNVNISVHARLPACFDQELLDFIAALVKATKVVEIEKQDSPMAEEVHGLKEFSRAVKGGLKGATKKAVVDGVVNERWIAKLVGKITKKLEMAQGDVGYSGDIPVPLEKYRTGLLEIEGEKILP